MKDKGDDVVKFAHDEGMEFVLKAADSEDGTPEEHRAGAKQERKGEVEEKKGEAYKRKFRLDLDLKDPPMPDDGQKLAEEIRKLVYDKEYYR